MKLDVAGRIRNVPLPASKPLLPLYEAIVNSIHATEEKNPKEAKIEIRILRDENSIFASSDRHLKDIVGFEIKDNGIGFTQKHFESFGTSDTQVKVSKGGKGIGRLLWLVAFDSAEIESLFEEDSKQKKRTFSFSIKGDGVKEHQVSDVDFKATGTKVRLNGFKEQYQRMCPKRLDTIAAHIVEYCLEYFLTPDPPDVTLIDSDGEAINLNSKFESEMVGNSERTSSTIGGEVFEFLHVRLYSEGIISKKHHINYCAHHRVVKSEPLIGKLPNLMQSMQDSDGRAFIYTVYVESSVLDRHVNAERTDFTVVEDDSELFDRNISWKMIRENVLGECKKYLQPYTEEIHEKKLRRIKIFIDNEAPMYRPILVHAPEAIEYMNPDATDKELEIHLYQAYSDIQSKLKVEGQSLLGEENREFVGYQEKLNKYLEKVNSINASDLARYVCHRKTVLDFIASLLKLQVNGKYSREDAIHDAVFPRGRTSSEIDGSSHNLWLIDEKLVFHNFLASDKALSSMPTLECKSAKEPDLIVFDAPFAITPTNEPPFPAITIIEFKRPMRDGYTEDENPLAQVTDYIEAIRAGSVTTYEGRPIATPSNMPFYCYIVCDMNEKLEQLANRYELSKTPDGQGYYGFKKGFNAYIEIISYDKMVSDAKKRNAAFFDKLNLPSKI